MHHRQHHRNERPLQVPGRPRFRIGFRYDIHFVCFYPHRFIIGRSAAYIGLIYALRAISAPHSTPLERIITLLLKFFQDSIISQFSLNQMIHWQTLVICLQSDLLLWKLIINLIHLMLVLKYVNGILNLFLINQLLRYHMVAQSQFLYSIKILIFG